jgi:integrase
VGQCWIDGRRRKVRAATKTDVAAAMGRLIHGDETARSVDRRANVRSLLSDWQAKALANRDLAPSTRETHAWACGLLTAELGSVRLDALDVHSVERSLGRLARGSQGKPLARASLIKIRSTLRQALAWAEKRRAIGHNPAAVAELPAGAVVGDQLQALDTNHQPALFAVAADHPYGAIFVLMATTGLRPGEASGLTDDAVDLAGTVAVVRAVQLTHGRPVLTTDLKTAASRRTIRLPEIALDALARHIAERAPDGLLFTASDGGPLWPSTVRAELARLCNAAGVPVVRPNELRHSFATIAAESGMPLHVVADILGQTTTRMLDQTYRHRPPVISGPETLWEIVTQPEH